MNVGKLQEEARERLAAAGIPSPADEARLLMAETLGTSTAWVMAHPEAQPPPDQEALFRSRVQRRLRHEPVAYVLGHKEFYGLDFLVTPEVLIPRPETELLVDRALAEAARLLAIVKGPLLTVDLGTGSGAVAVALALRQPGLRLIAVDSSPSALAVARINVTRHAVAERIDFRLGDILDAVPERLDLVVANLPYIASAEIGYLMPDVREYEPREALDGGPDGTVPTRRALEQAAEKMRRPGALLFEIGDGQGDALRPAAQTLYPDAVVEIQRDYAGFERILRVDLPARDGAA